MNNFEILFWFRVWWCSYELCKRFYLFYVSELKNSWLEVMVCILIWISSYFLVRWLTHQLTHGIVAPLNHAVTRCRVERFGGLPTCPYNISIRLTAHRGGRRSLITSCVIRFNVSGMWLIELYLLNWSNCLYAVVILLYNDFRVVILLCTSIYYKNYIKNNSVKKSNFNWKLGTAWDGFFNDIFSLFIVNLT